MDIPVPVGDATDGSVPPEQPEQPQQPEQPEQAQPPQPPEDLSAQIAALTRRLDDMAESFDASVRRAVSEEVQRVAGDLQHTVTALGRILVRDLGKLSQILNEHRDKIVAQLREGPVASAPRDATGTTIAPRPVEPAEEEGTAEPPADGSDPAESADADAASGRQWRGRRRKT